MKTDLRIAVAAPLILLMACGDDGVHGDAGLDTETVCHGACGDVGGHGDVGPDAESACYRPGTDLTLVLQPGAVGCACTTADRDVCVGGMGYICMGFQWKAVIDGPCFPVDPPWRDAGAVDVPLDAWVGADTIGGQATMDGGETCGNSTCQPGEFCVPGCIGTCYCPPAPDGGVCPHGPCGCGAMVGCA